MEKVAHSKLSEVDSLCLLDTGGFSGHLTELV